MPPSPSARPRSDPPPPRYGDYRWGFPDLPPDDPIDLEKHAVIERLLTRAEPDTTLALVTPGLLRRMLPTLSIPEHVWLFWAMVVERSERPVRPRPPPLRREPIGPVEALNPEPPLDESGRRIARYGDYPELFWNCRPNEPIDFHHPAVVAHVLLEGTPEQVWELIPFELLERTLPDLVLPESTRRFWGMVLDARRKAIRKDR